ncbi:MAG: HPr family phosphocarrier protein [Acidobacteria bacterium]|nr:HPr family phosphocarrier protein [Acidobacteriota bacterium]
MIERRLQIVNKLGLHARAAAKLVRAASGFRSQIVIRKDGNEVDGKSILGVLMLAAAQGTQITLRVTGQDERDAADALQSLIADRFGERE